MAVVRRMFVSLKYVIPEDLEYYLEQQAAQGFHLKPIGQMGLFYYEFTEEKPKKCRYIVDHPSIPKEQYFPKMSESEWEYMGKVGNCIVWRKEYEKDRPEDIVDHYDRQKYCKMLGIIFTVLTLFFVAAMIAMLAAVRFEMVKGMSRYRTTYIVEALMQVPFVLYFGWASRKLSEYRERIPKRKPMKKDDE